MSLARVFGLRAAYVRAVVRRGHDDCGRYAMVGME